MAGTLQSLSGRQLSPRAGFTSLGRLRDEMEELFDQLWGDGNGLSAKMLAPPIDVSENEGSVQVRMDLPGVDPADIDIQISGNLLTISGERKEEQEEKGETFHRLERRSGSFSRSVTLPCPVDEEKIDATCKEGILRITVPKSEAAKSKRIEVKPG